MTSLFGITGITVSRYHWYHDRLPGLFLILSGLADGRFGGLGGGLLRLGRFEGLLNAIAFLVEILIFIDSIEVE